MNDKFKLKQCITITANDPLILQRVYTALFNFLDDVEKDDLRVSIVETNDYSKTLHIRIIKEE